MKNVIKYHWRALLWVLLIFAGCLLPPSDLPSTSLFSKIPYFDKIVHFFIYFIFTLFLLAGFNRWHTVLKFKSILISFAIAFLCGLSVEVLQEVMNIGRTGDSFDMLANTGGILAGILFYAPLKWILRNIL